MGRSARMDWYRIICTVYHSQYSQFSLVSVSFQRKIHSDKDNIGSYQYCAVCCYAVLYGKFGAFAFLNLGGARIGRTIHLVSTAWVFVLMSLHLGLHLAPFANKLKKHRQFLWAGRIIAVLLAAYGVYVFVDRAFYEELFYLTEFKFFDTDKSAALYFFETIAMSSAFATLSYYGKKLLQMKSRQTKI